MDSGAVSTDSGQGERRSERWDGWSRILQTGGSVGGETTGDEAISRDREVERGGRAAAAGGGRGVGGGDRDGLGAPGAGEGSRSGMADSRGPGRREAGRASLRPEAGRGQRAGRARRRAHPRGAAASSGDTELAVAGVPLRESRGNRYSQFCERY